MQTNLSIRELHALKAANCFAELLSLGDVRHRRVKGT